MLPDYPARPTRTSPYLPAPYLQALGNIAAYYAYLESATEVTIWAFLGLDYHLGTAVTAHMGTISRIQLLTILADQHLAELPEVHEHFKEMLTFIDAARVKRNDYIHAMWKYEKDRKAPFIKALKRSAKGVVKTTDFKATTADLKRLAAEIEWLTNGLQGFVDTMFPEAYVPWPRSLAAPKSRKRG